MKANDTPRLTTFIYGLYDPRNPIDVRYIGKANDIRLRLEAHASLARNPKSIRNLRLLGWIRRLLSDGIKPRISVLEECKISQWRDREKFWIEKSRLERNSILNIDDGGNGIAFINDETRRRMSEAHKGKNHSLEHRRNIGLGQLGNKRGEATRKKQSDIAKARGIAHLQTKEVRAKAAASLKGRKFSNAHRAALSIASKRRWLPGGDMWILGSPMRGRKHSEKTREKMREAHAWRRHA
jgi:hypothetical protein